MLKEVRRRRNSPVMAATVTTATVKTEKVMTVTVTTDRLRMLSWTKTCRVCPLNL